MVNADYIYLDSQTLQTIKAQCLACLQDNFRAHQSYSIAGRTITRANVGQVSQILGSVSFAIDYQTNGAQRTSVPNMNNLG